LVARHQGYYSAKAYEQQDRPPATFLTPVVLDVEPDAHHDTPATVVIAPEPPIGLHAHVPVSTASTAAVRVVPAASSVLLRGLDRAMSEVGCNYDERDSTIAYRWRSNITGEELVRLTDSYGGRTERGWWDRTRPRSLGWVAAHLDDGSPVGFVNVAWDGGDHAFLLDTKVRADLQRRRIGTELVRRAVLHARHAGCEWIHVDFEMRLAPFYLEACGFRSTPAGLIHLPRLPDGN
jgi:GNAT superfamily N-acetyltransferase